MKLKNDIEAIVLGALSRANEEMPQPKRFVVNSDSAIFGPESNLDSLGLVSVIVDVESEVTILLNKQISLTDDRAMNQEESPYATVQTLVNYIYQLATERDI